ncbi:tetratricopeptide repeat protein, partial [bacterium]|nr:tetratricopeptide repeat protein [bacterium]
DADIAVAPFDSSLLDAAIGLDLVFPLDANAGEADCCGMELGAALALYEDGETLRLHDALIDLFIRRPNARDLELPRLLEAEAFYLNARARRAASGEDDAFERLRRESGAPNNDDLVVRFAKPIYSDLLSLYPASTRRPQQLFRMASILYAQEYEPEALAHYELLIDADPKGPLARKAHIARGRIFLRLSDTANAADEFARVYEDAAAADAERFAAALGIAVAQSRIGMHESAARLFDEALGVAGDRSRFGEDSLYAYGEAIRALGRRAAAREIFAELIARFPETDYRLVSWFRIAQMHQDDGDAGDALAIFHALVRRAPDSEWGLASSVAIARAAVAAAPGTVPEEAARQYGRAMTSELFPEIAHDAQFEYARMLADAGRTADALDAVHRHLTQALDAKRLRRGLDLMATVFEAFAGDAYARGEFDRLANAFAEIVPFVFNHRMSADTFDRVAWALEEGLYLSSLRVLAVSKTAVRLFSERAELARARALDATGDHDGALVIFETLAKTEKGHVGRQAAIELVRAAARDANDLRVVAMSEKALALPHPPADRAELLILRSRAGQNVGDSVASAEGFRQAVDLLLPADTSRERRLAADALFGLGTTLYESGRGGAARPVLEAAVGAFPDDPRAGLASLYLESEGAKVPAPVGDPYWSDLTKRMTQHRDFMRELNARMKEG